MKLTKAQVYLLDESRRTREEAHKKIKDLYSEFYNIMTTIPNQVIGLVFEDGIENKNPNYKIDLVSNIMHQIGYWEGQKVKSNEIIMFMTMNDEDYIQYQNEQEYNKLHNKRNFERIKQMLFKDRGLFEQQ